MAFIYADRVKETSASTGPGNFVLGGAVAGFQTFAAGIGDNNQTYYTILNEVDDNWEVGNGTYVGGVLFRDTIYASSNGNMVVDFGIGTKTVLSTIAGQFFGTVLTLAQHAALNHTGITGVPAPETFTESVHEFVDHTQAPFNLLDADAHGSLDHVLSPPSLMSAASHFALSHAGLPGINAFDAGAHSLTNHAGLPGVPAPEAFTEAAHAATDHTLIPGVVPPVPAVDVVAQVIAQAAEDSTVDLTLTAGTWAICAWGAWRSGNFNGNTLAPSNLRIGGVIVSTLLGTDGNIDGAEVYAHFGVRLGVAGNQVITCDFDVRNLNLSIPSEPRIRAFAFRTA